ncbi:MAG: Maf family nucleotide pyrophosphatase [Acidiferrobacterales bacterium]|nr:Maf family nucleotide pyrophosphatase [Acidiferrobacterales bacterium]
MHLPCPQLILASSSPYRRDILVRLGLSFESVSPDIDESRLPNESAQALVQRLATSKAQKVASELSEGLVIGSDQVCELGDQILGKPRDHKNAIEQLRMASGREAFLYNGIAVIDARTHQVLSKLVVVRVVYRKLDDQEIERYLRTDQPYDCCGSLKVESLGISLLSAIESDDPNAITGMPVIALLSLLRQFGAILP